MISNMALVKIAVLISLVGFAGQLPAQYVGPYECFPAYNACAEPIVYSEETIIHERCLSIPGCKPACVRLLHNDNNEVFVEGSVGEKRKRVKLVDGQRDYCFEVIRRSCGYLEICVANVRIGERRLQCNLFARACQTVRGEKCWKLINIPIDKTW